MEIYLVRHTTPAVEKGICYGQSDLNVTESFASEAAVIQQHLPAGIISVYSSPLQRCGKLASYLFPGHDVQLHDHLMEINCGSWELKCWDDIPKEQTAAWMDNLIHARIPGGESYTDLFERVSRLFDQIHREPRPSVIVAHGGVIRSMLCYITNTPLADSFKLFSLHYGCVVKITNNENGFQHQVLSNIPHEKETHKPSYL